MNAPSWPATFGVAGHLPVLTDWHGCKIDRVCLRRIEHSVRRRFEAREVSVWTKRRVPGDRWFPGSELQELLSDPGVRWFAPADASVELDNLFFVVKSTELEFVLELTQLGVVAYGDGDAERLDHMVGELEKLLDPTRARFALKSVPSRAVGAVGGGVVGLLGALFTGLGVTDRSWSSMLLMTGILLTCVVSGWLLIDRLKHQSKVQLFWAETVPTGWWSRWEPNTKIAFVALLISSISTVLMGVNVYLTHSDTGKLSMPAVVVKAVGTDADG
ncbi:hypothetical protein [Streptomyces mirabilis]